MQVDLSSQSAMAAAARTQRNAEQRIAMLRVAEAANADQASKQPAATDARQSPPPGRVIASDIVPATHVTTAETAQAKVASKSSKSEAADGSQTLPADMLRDDLIIDQEMTIPEALNYAITHHPLLRSRQHEIELAEAQLIGAGIFPNPQFVFDQTSPTQGAGPTELSSRLMFTIPLGGRIGFAVAAAEATVQKATWTLSKETELILFEAADAAVEVMYLQELVDLYTEQIALAEHVRDLTEKALEARSNAADVIVAKVNLADVKLQQLNSIALLKLARLRLSRAIGLETPRLVKIEGRLSTEPLPPLSLEKILASVRETRPEIAEARSAVEEARRALQLAHAESIPDLEIGPRFQDDLHSPTDSMGARLQFDLPLFDRNQGGIAEGAAQLRVNQSLVKVAELTTLNDVAGAFVELGPVQARINHYHQEIEPELSRLKETLEKVFRAGLISAPQMADEMQRQFKLKVENLTLRYRYNQLKVKLELFLGRPLADFAVDNGQPTTRPQSSAQPPASSNAQPSSSGTPSNVPTPQPSVAAPESRLVPISESIDDQTPPLPPDTKSSRQETPATAPADLQPVTPPLIDARVPSKLFFPPPRQPASSAAKR